MGLFSGLFGKSIKIDHPFFGKMLFVDSKNSPDGYFECRRHFAPKDDIIEICIAGTAEGPTQQQIDFFTSIENNYDAISASITPLLEEEVGNYIEFFHINDFRKEFKLVFMDIPKCDTQPIVWEIAFHSDHDRDHQFTLTMKDFTATAVLIDG